MKYIVVETWNGDGYSDANTAEIMEFKDDRDAHDYLRLRMSEQTNAIINENEIGYISYEKPNNDYSDYGSFRFYPYTNDIIGIVIIPGMNEVNLITNLTDWIDLIDLATGQADQDELEEIDFDANSFFIPAYDGDNDYQFIKL
jgi:hypothetical protein